MTFEEQLKPIIEKAIAAAEATGEFVVEQAPILLQEFYTWHTISAVLSIVIGLLIAILPTVLIKRISEDKSGEKYHTTNFWGKTIDNDWGEAAFGISVLSIIIGAVMFIINIYDLCKLIFAPRLYIIEYFMN